MLDTKVSLVVTSFALLSATLCVVTYLTVLLKQDCSSCHNTPNKKDDFGGNSVTDDGVLRLISRDGWSAQPPRENYTSLELPVRIVIIAHTVTESCKTLSSCTYRVHTIQEQHLNSNDFVDIGYNFLVGGDGAAYEGRSWDNMGAHTAAFNKKSICVAFIGTFITQKPSEKQLKAAKLLLKEGVRQGKLAPNYRLYGARQLMPTESPGTALYEIIQTWPNWSDEI